MDKINKLIQDTDLEDKRFLILSMLNIMRGAKNNEISCFMNSSWNGEKCLEIIGDGLHIKIAKVD
jgi:hypothetical protein